MIRRSHMTRLFGAAYDGTLNDSEAKRFRAHLQACTRCSDGFERYRAGLKALSSLPMARMPRPVHVPTDAAVRRSSAAPPRRTLRWLMPGSAGIAAVAAVAAVVLVGLHGVHSGAGSSNAPAAAPANAAAAGCPLQVLLQPTTQSPSQATSVSARDLFLPGTALVVSGSTMHAAPGSMVQVQVALVRQGNAMQPAVATACVTVSADGEVIAASTAAPQSTAGHRQATNAEQEEELSFTVPSGARPGSTVQVSVTVTTGSSAHPLAATLLITVT